MYRTRVRKFVDEQFGKGKYEEVLNGERGLIINGRTYSVKELLETNVFVRDDAKVSIFTINKEYDTFKEQDDNLLLNQIALLTLEMVIGKKRLADVMAGIAVLAINGEQVVVRNLDDAALYDNLSDKDRILVILAAAGG